MICEACQQAIPNRATRGPLTAIDEPPRVFYKGMVVPMPGMEARLLMLLIRLGKASHFALSVVCTGEDVEDPIRQMQLVVYRVRRKLPPNVKIQTIHQWGYELVIDE